MHANEMIHMRNVEKREILEKFGKKTYYRGEDYFSDSHVVTGVKKEDMLYGTVRGTEQSPYHTWVQITDDIYSGCSCPVGALCKHGVALLLQWQEDKASFIDVDDLLLLLQKKQKEDLVNMIALLLEKNPLLAEQIAFIECVSRKKVTGSDISKQWDQFLSKHEYYVSLSEFTMEFTALKSVGDTYASENYVESAVEVYLSLLKEGITLYEYVMEDIDDTGTEVMMECIEDVIMLLDQLSEEQKTKYIPDIMELIQKDEHGLGSGRVLLKTASRENLPIIEHLILESLESLSEGTFQREHMLDILADLYVKFSMYSKATKMMKDMGLRDASDYYRIAKVYSSSGDNKTAFDYVRKGLSISDSDSYNLERLYFTLLHTLLNTGMAPAIDVQEALSVAVNLISHYYSLQQFGSIKHVFETMGKYELLISEIKEKCDATDAVEILLHEKKVDELIDFACSSDTLPAQDFMTVALLARKKGDTKTSLYLMSKALKRGVLLSDSNRDEMISFFVRESDDEIIKSVMNNVSIGAVKPFVTALIGRNQEYAMKILRDRVYELDIDEMKEYVVHLDPENAEKICQVWIEHAVNRSRYDDAVEILQVLKNRMEEKEWESYISSFKSTHYRKRNLMAKMGRM